MLFKKIMHFNCYEIAMCGERSRCPSGHAPPNGLRVFSSFSSVNFDYADLSGDGHTFGQFPLGDLIP